MVTSFHGNIVCHVNIASWQHHFMAILHCVSRQHCLAATLPRGNIISWRHLVSSQHCLVAYNIASWQHHFMATSCVISALSCSLQHCLVATSFHGNIMGHVSIVSRQHHFMATSCVISVLSCNNIALWQNHGSHQHCLMATFNVNIVLYADGTCNVATRQCC